MIKRDLEMYIRKFAGKSRLLTATLFSAAFTLLVSSIAPAATLAVTPNPLLIEHGHDVGTAATTAAHAAQIDALPFDGISVSLAHEAFSGTPVSLATAQTELAAMPALQNVKHNFLIFRMLDNGTSRNKYPYNLYNDTVWNTISANSGNFAKAAAATGKFDGIIIDDEYYGSSPAYQWDYGTSTTPWTYSKTAGATPGKQPADAQAKAQARGKQMMDAIKLNWPTVNVLIFHGATTAEPASYTADRMMGNNIAWANELMGPWVVGFVQSAKGSTASVIDGGESYWQRTNQQFANAYNWMKTGFPDFGGRLVPATGVTAAEYKATIKADVGVFDSDVSANYVPFTPAKVQELLTYGLHNADNYEWYYTEAYDYRGTGWPVTPVTQPYLDAVRNAKNAP